jgi:ribosomal protein S18 acetylase RimI-like enzyme
MKPQLTIRPSQHKDKPHITRFCHHTFDWGDYIPDVWDGWMKNRAAQLFTALINNHPVGLMRVSMAKAGEAWLQAARTHPDYRRRGVATALTRACLHWARTRGAEIARLATQSDNVSAQKTLHHLAFHQISEFLVMKCPRLTPQTVQRSRWAKPADTDAVWSFLLRSATYRQAAGLYTIVFTYFSLDKQDLTEFVHTERAVVHESNDVIDGLTLVDDTPRQVWPEENPLQTCYVDGDQQAIVDMMTFVKNYAWEQAFRNVYAFACNTPLIATALTQAGFTSESTPEGIYEKKLVSEGRETRTH